MSCLTLRGRQVLDSALRAGRLRVKREQIQDFVWYVGATLRPNDFASARKYG